MKRRALPVLLASVFAALPSFAGPEAGPITYPQPPKTPKGTTTGPRAARRKSFENYIDEQKQVAIKPVSVTDLSGVSVEKVVRPNGSKTRFFRVSRNSSTPKYATSPRLHRFIPDRDGEDL